MMSSLLNVGDCVNGYTITGLLGEGGMGIVYSANHARLGRVAMKVLRPELTREKRFVERFAKEAEAVVPLDHPHIVRTYSFDVVEGPEGVPLHYLVSELLEGVDLCAFVKRKGPLPEKVALTIGDQVADALEQIHGNGVIHRDLKTENIYLLSKAERHPWVKVIDFGLAKFLVEGKGYETNPGLAAGTPMYMAPEQVLGKPLDPRTDIYALGLALYEALSGEYPFSSDTPLGELMVSQVKVNLPAIEPRRGKPVTPAVETLIRRCLYKEQEMRPESATVLRKLFRALLDPGEVVARVGGDPILRAELVQQQLEQGQNEREALRALIAKKQQG
jgi:serine/threonine-protein kinase